MNAQCGQDALSSQNDQMPGGRLIPVPPASLPLADVVGKAVALDFDGGLLSSDAGLVLLKDSEAQRGLSRALADVLKAPRDPRRITLSYQDLIQQRGFQLAAGYEEGNDSTTFRHDPIFKLLRNRLLRIPVETGSGALLVMVSFLSR